jgi:NADH-quinone oxidoreductase subunit I
MGVTLENFFRRAVTVQYPEERAALPERFRGRLCLNLKTCIGCTLCSQVCPNGTIQMVRREKTEQIKTAQKRDFLLFPQVNIAMCTYCGWCSDVCPVGAIQHSREFELARYDREHFVYTPEMLAQSEEELAEKQERPRPTAVGGEG